MNPEQIENIVQLFLGGKITKAEWDTYKENFPEIDWDLELSFERNFNSLANASFYAALRERTDKDVEVLDKKVKRTNVVKYILIGTSILLSVSAFYILQSKKEGQSEVLSDKISATQSEVIKELEANENRGISKNNLSIGVRSADSIATTLNDVTKQKSRNKPKKEPILDASPNKTAPFEIEKPLLTNELYSLPIENKKEELKTEKVVIKCNLETLKASKIIHPCDEEKNGQIIVNLDQIRNGTPPYKMAISKNNFEVEEFKNLDSGKYILTIIDVNNCKNQEVLNLKIQNCPPKTRDYIFSLTQDNYVTFNALSGVLRLEISKMNGNLVFEKQMEADENTTLTWEGKDFDDRRMENGLYLYRIYKNNSLKEHGQITMID
jgi:hypothetical protein